MIDVVGCDASGTDAFVKWNENIEWVTDLVLAACDATLQFNGKNKQWMNLMGLIFTASLCMISVLIQTFQETRTHRASRQNFVSPKKKSLNGFETDDTLGGETKPKFTTDPSSLLSCVCVCFRFVRCWCTRLLTVPGPASLGCRPLQDYQTIALILTLSTIKAQQTRLALTGPFSRDSRGGCFLFSDFHFVPAESNFSPTIMSSSQAVTSQHFGLKEDSQRLEMDNPVALSKQRRRTTLHFFFYCFSNTTHTV